MAKRLHLPLYASQEAIAEAIETVQARCKAPLANPQELSRRVRAQLDRGEALAHVHGGQLSAMDPHLQDWEGNSSVATIVLVTTGQIQVYRGSPQVHMRPGHLTTTLRPPTQTLAQKWAEAVPS